MQKANVVDVGLFCCWRRPSFGDEEQAFLSHLQTERLGFFAGAVVELDAEPGCAVQAAYAEGLIASSRYASYLSMLEDYDNRR